MDPAGKTALVDGLSAVIENGVEVGGPDPPDGRELRFVEPGG
ncbi:hypothetical protein [Isoptericola sediminis]|nr:hypothetical protein [Isoptericola sediminis]